MKLLLIFMFFTPFGLQAEESCVHDDSSFRCVKYVKNYDADTITFNVPNVHPLIGKKINIRVLGVDTPEIRTKNKCENLKYLGIRLVSLSMKGSACIMLFCIS